MKQEAAWELGRNQKLIFSYHLLFNHYLRKVVKAQVVYFTNGCTK